MYQVSQKLLNRAQVRARLQQVCREGVTQRVRADRAGHPSLLRGVTDDAVDTAGGETTTALIQKERVSCARVRTGGARFGGARAAAPPGAHQPASDEAPRPWSC